jgi:hypothetical protein
VTTTKHPFDFDLLSKGTWIEASQLEAAAGVPPEHPFFALKVLRLRELIEEKTGILSCNDSGRLRLMTDAEALDWNIHQAADASRKLERTALRLRQNVDHTKLDSGQQRVHEHATRVVSAMAEAQKRERLKAARLFSALPKRIATS